MFVSIVAFPEIFLFEISRIVVLKPFGIYFSGDTRRPVLLFAFLLKTNCLSMKRLKVSLYFYLIDNIRMIGYITWP